METKKLCITVQDLAARAHAAEKPAAPELRDGGWAWLDTVREPLDEDFVAAALEEQPQQDRPELDKLFD
jgi:hypothetical protein